jgi:DNA-binding PadR family transcriptional regulator
MPRQKKSQFAILGLLSWKPMSGYDIKKYIELGLSHFWSESYGQLFPTLNRFVDEGLATSREVVSAGKRKKKLYKITPRNCRFATSRC